MRLVLGRGIALTAVGLCAGSVGAWALTRAMTTLLYGVTPTDPATFGAVVSVLMFVGVIACLLPALRATRVNPIAVLRDS